MGSISLRGDREYTLKWKKGGQLDHLAELAKILHSSLDLSKTVTDRVGGVDRFEESIAHRAFEEEEVSHDRIYLRSLRSCLLSRPSLLS